MNREKIQECLEKSDDLRPWQEAAFDKTLERFKTHDVCVVEVVTGGGKTYFGINIAAELALLDNYEEIVIVAPSVPIKDGWSEAMQKMGFVCTSADYATSGQDAYAITYSGIGNDDVREKLAKSRKRLAIFDEIHHPERDATWGNALEDICKRSNKQLLLTGTPWRTNGEIALLEKKGYYNNGEIEPDFKYRYAQDLTENVFNRSTVYAQFSFYSSKANKKDEKESIVFNAPLPGDEADWFRLCDEKDRRPLGPHVQIANNRISNNDMARAMFDDGIGFLEQAQRETKNRAMGLIVVSRMQEAKWVAEYMQEARGQSIEVIISEDDESSTKSSDRLKEIRAAKRTERPDWIVSVGMISEGVDIPELKVLVYLSAIMTMLYLVQVIGRVLRRIKSEKKEHGYLDDSPAQTPARVLMPAHPFLLHLGKIFENDKKASLEEAKNKDKEDGPEKERKEYENRGGDAKAELFGGSLLPAHMTRILSLLSDDEDAKSVVNPEFYTWAYRLCKNGEQEFVQTILADMVKRYDIEFDSTQSFEKQLDYDTCLRLIKKDAQRLRALIRFSHPKYKDIPRERDGEVFGRLSVEIDRLCGLSGKNAFKKASLEEKEKWVEIAESFYQQGISDGPGN